MADLSLGLGALTDAAGPNSILLLAALPQEVRPFLRLSRGQRRRGLPWPAWELALGERQALLVLTGMGATATREAVSRLVAQFRPHLLVSFGFGGAVSPDLQPGDLVLGESFCRYDPLALVIEPVVPAPVPPRPGSELLSSLTGAGLSAYSGSFVTTPWIIPKASQGGALMQLARPVLDLETAAAAALAGAEGIPFLALRAITDGAAEEIPDFLAPAGREPGAVRMLDALGWLVADLRRLADLVQLWRRSRLAAARLAEALMVLWPLLEE